MADPIRRVETTHIDEVKRTATTTPQWFAELRHKTHPITHNSQLNLFICGEEGFADIAKQIEKAKATIDLVCWGFDPGMELIRNAGSTWPRGETYGDLLNKAASRGVKIRLLVWYDSILSKVTKNIPGFSHGTRPWTVDSRYKSNASKVNAKHSLAMLQTNYKSLRNFIKGNELTGEISAESIPLLAREEYCHSWFKVSEHNRMTPSNQINFVNVRIRDANGKNVTRSLSSEDHQPASMSTLELERLGLIHAATHHQKTILIDFAYEEGKKAVGYVMGLNSVTDYWDTCEHKLEDPRREQGAGLTKGECVQGKETDQGFLSLKPYQDYACRIDGGKALVGLYDNFVKAWARTNAQWEYGGYQCDTDEFSQCTNPPAELLRKAEPGNSTVQIIRTQPDEDDKTIKEVYYLATDAACLASGYLYIENQYFQNEEWAKRLMQKRKDVVAAWQRGAAKAGKNLKDMPIMHVFIVIPIPERAQMIPSTYDTLAVLGDPSGMKGQVTLIGQQNRGAGGDLSRDARGIPKPIPNQSKVVKHANEIEKRDTKQLEAMFGLRVSTAMLQTSGIDKGRVRYREIYIHSKLMLADDSFMTLGSANMNQRSMAVDSELNIATNDRAVATSLRKRVWNQLSGGKIDGANGSAANVKEAFFKWTELMDENKVKKMAGLKMTGFLLPIEDDRSSTIRLG